MNRHGFLIDIPKGTADVIVCDGFTGNVVLKIIEGMAETVKRIARAAYEERVSWKIAMWLLASGIRQNFSPETSSAAWNLSKVWSWFENTPAFTMPSATPMAPVSVAASIRWVAPSCFA